MWIMVAYIVANTHVCVLCIAYLYLFFCGQLHVCRAQAERPIGYNSEHLERLRPLVL